jgi:hypothetical protein
MNIIIFSKDRACQCDLTLTSLFKNAKELCHNVSVLYTGSNERYFLGYNKLIEKWKKDVVFVKQGIFKDDLISLAHTTFAFNCFFTDDDIIYRPIEDCEIIRSLLERSPEICTFSLRMGSNITIQDYHRNIPIVRPDITYYNDINIWKWRNAFPNTNYSYPLSVDGHIFRTEEINRFLDKFDYDNPNSFEGRIQQFNDKLPPLMCSFSKSVVVNTPINRVQETCTNLAGVQYGITPEYMNDLWIQGFSINLDKMNFSNIYGCHQELPIPLRNIINEN